jgi:hypothetical protein
MDRYSKFRRIPPERVTESSLVAWIVFGGLLEQIPKEHRTERVLWAAARHDDTSYALIGQDEVADHQALSLEALARGTTSFSKIPWEHKDEDFIIQMTIDSTNALQGINFAAAYSHLITDKVAQAICSRSVSHAYGFWVAGGDEARALIKDSYIEAAFDNECKCFAELERFGQTKMLAAKLAAGFWPKGAALKTSTGLELAAEPPADPMTALILMNNSRARGHQVLYKCWLLSRPVEEVIDGLQSRKVGLAEIFNLYSEADLRKHMKTYRSIRGRFLEQDLGM